MGWWTVPDDGGVGFCNTFLTFQKVIQFFLFRNVGNSVIFDFRIAQNKQHNHCMYKYDVVGKLEASSWNLPGTTEGKRGEENNVTQGSWYLGQHLNLKPPQIKSRGVTSFNMNFSQSY